ncbi:Na+/Pi-cotransporter [Sporotomaculum syntrophicum]|uniref:Na+/Pi-cotransporter n=1 Tax=Sporotomaculum syntrophicum TaxID=182264 RepID=A0A9D2WN58_9FIRM|nr:Na/Pi cotransporter family protein [Sporotomaculum syntrophicum]KAF1084354.1 Na+/Pi-cotransporter [Sporotomaculum syntrophicum]
MELGKNLLFGLMGGMGLLLYGMYIMSEGLQKIAGHRLRSLLSTLTHNRCTALLVGAVVTMLFQSSTATTVILVGLTSASIMSLKETLGVILGADIGTTVTAQLIALKVTEIALPIMTIGALITFFCRQDQYKRVGQVLLGFGLLFFGLKLMAATMQPLKDEPFFRHMLVSAGDYPLLAIFAAALFTFLVQSSAASVGIIMVMAMQNLVPLHSAIYLLFGANIGTSFTALLTSLGSSREARRVAAAHLLFKTSGVLLLLPFVGLYALLMTKITAAPVYQVANAHTFFNIAIAILFLPFINQFARLLQIIIPDRKGPHERQLKTKYLDEKLINTPSIALGLASKERDNAADQVYFMIQSIIKVFEKNDTKLLGKINRKEDYLDLLCQSMTNYLTSVMRQPLSRKEFNRCMSNMHIVADLEHIGDIIEKDITYIANSKISRQYQFSAEGWEEIKDMHRRLVDLMRMANVALVANDIELANEAIKGCSELALMERQLRTQHFKRLKQGTEKSVSTSALHLDLINSLLRISEHISNICYEIATGGGGSDTNFSHYVNEIVVPG